MRRDESVYLKHILDAISKIEEYLEGIGESAFYNHTLIQDAVIRQLQIIGEAVKRLSDDLRSDYIPWQDIAGMRNKLVHDYFGVDMSEVWLTAKEDIPLLKTEIMVIKSKISK